ncbi:ion channel [Mycolicibacterium vulneris]|nr:ion channel [Mycolicibacterium vulneris]
MSTQQRQSWWDNPRLRFVLIKVLAPTAMVYVATSSWRGLGGPAPRLGIYHWANVGFAALLGIGYIWALLRHKRFRSMPTGFAAFLVIYFVVDIEGLFAQTYYAMSVQMPHSFEPPLTGVDAAYFTISTATTTGMGDIHPVSSLARKVVSAQMVASLYLVVIALVTAVQRVLATPAKYDRV